ncbi:transketolase family protein [Patescibacteria group bacterium]
MKLNEDWRDGAGSATRDGFGAGLVEAGERHSEVYAACADLTESTRMKEFKERFPERFVQLGVSEQLLVALGAGLALAGKVPFLGSFAMFSPGRSWEQVRNNLCLNGANAKVVGSHAGLTVGGDGATHQALEDLAITRTIPNLTVVVPCDAPQARQATLALAEHVGPAYLRLGRGKIAPLTTDGTPFEIGQAQTFREGTDLAIIACGTVMHEALAAAEELAGEGLDCRVLNMHTVKPMDRAAVLAAAEQCGAIVTVEDHQVRGGMGSRVAEILAEERPVPIQFVGVQDAFGQSGRPEELLAEYGLDAAGIKEAARRAHGRKTGA